MSNQGLAAGAVAVSLLGSFEVARADGADDQNGQSGHRDDGSAAANIAPRIEDYANQMGSIEVDRIRRLSLSALNSAAEDQFGKFDAAKAEALGQSAYFLDQDVDVFVVGEGNALQYLAVPIGTLVSPDGAVVVPDSAWQAGYGSPVFGGPWGGETINFYAATNVDDGGVVCTNTTAQNTLRATYRKLSDTSSSYDYYGVDLASVAVVTDSSSCNDYVNTAAIGVKSMASSAIFASENPIVGSSGSCTSSTVSVGASYSGVSASISQNFTRCELIGITGALQSASTFRRNSFNNNNNCHAGDQPYDGRELAHVSVIRVAQGAGPSLVYSYAVDAGNTDTCKEDNCDGS